MDQFDSMNGVQSADIVKRWSALRIEAFLNYLIITSTIEGGKYETRTDTAAQTSMQLAIRSLK